MKEEKKRYTFSEFKEKADPNEISIVSNMRQPMSCFAGVAYSVILDKIKNDDLTYSFEYVVHPDDSEIGKESISFHDKGFDSWLDYQEALFLGLIKREQEFMAGFVGESTDGKLKGIK